jgi:hypothetical protein
MGQNINISGSLTTSLMGENFALNEEADQKAYIDMLMQEHPGFNVVPDEPAEFQDAAKKACLDGLVKGVKAFKRQYGSETRPIYEYPVAVFWYQDTIEPAVKKELCKNSVVKKHWEEPTWAGKDHIEVQCGNLARIVSGTYPSYVSHRKRNEKWSPDSVRL